MLTFPALPFPIREYYEFSYLLRFRYFRGIMFLVYMIIFKTFLIKKKNYTISNYLFLQKFKTQKFINFEAYMFLPALLKQVKTVEKEVGTQVLSRFDSHEIIQGLNSYKFSKLINCDMITTPMRWQDKTYGDTIFSFNGVPIHSIEYKMVLSENFTKPLDRAKFFQHHFKYEKVSQVELGFSDPNLLIKMSRYPHDTLEIPKNKFLAVDYSSFYSGNFTADKKVLNQLLESYYTDYLATQHMIDPIFEKLMENEKNNHFPLIFNEEVGAMSGNYITDILSTIPL